MHFPSLRVVATLVVLLLTTTAARAQAVQWAVGAHVNSSPQQLIRAGHTTITPSGEMYASYTYNSDLTLGGMTIPFNNSRFENTCVVYFDATGQPAGLLYTPGRTAITSLISDAAGNVYASGSIYDSLVVGSNSWYAADSHGIETGRFVAKWNAGRQLQWLKQQHISSSVVESSSSCTLLTVDNEGNLTLIGLLKGVVRFDTTDIHSMPRVRTRLSQDFGSLFCIQFDSLGSVKWAYASRQPDSVSTAIPNSACADPVTGDLFISGSAKSFTWRGQTIGPGSAKGYYWMRLSRSGAVRATFSVIISGGGWAYPYVAPAENGSSYLMMVANCPIGYSLNGAAIPSSRFNNYQTIGQTLARLDPAGVPQWTRTINEFQTDIARPNLISRPGLTLSTSTCYMAGTYSSALPGGMAVGNTTLPPTNGHHIGFVAAFNGLTGHTDWALPLATDVRIGDVVLMGLTVSPAGQIGFIGEVSFSDTVRFGNSLYIGYPSTSGHRHAFAAKLLPAHNLMQGTVFRDANGNGLFDNGDAPFGGVIVEEQPSGTVRSTTAAGRYEAVTELGLRTVNLPAPPLYYTAVPAGPTTASFSTFGNLSGNHDFALQPLADQQDLRVSLTLVGRVRPGFPVRYHVTYHNVGTTPMPSGAVTLVLDSRLTYQSNTGGGTLSGGILTAPYANLLPNEMRDFEVLAQVSTQAQRNDTLTTTAQVNPLTGDLTPADNVETARDIITGSYDPNDITVNRVRLTPTQVAGGEWLEYTIRFQNVGTDTAFSVLLRDSLPASQLDLTTLQLVAMSHPATWELAEQWLTVQFADIRLPHQAANALGSQGFVRFRVRPRPTLVLGEVVPNRAAIYFDFNAPVITNTATTTVALPAGVRATAATLPAVVWPNPATDQLHVETTLPVAAPLHLTLLDAVGRVVRERTVAAATGRVQTTLALAGLPAGLYVVRATAGSISFTRRVVVQ